MMRCRISSNINDLEELHKIHKWIPGKDNIRPLPEIIDKKTNFIKNLDFFYKTGLDYILADIFQFTSNINKDGKIYVLNKDIKQKYIFSKNIFPYNLPEETEHYILWYSYTSEFTDDKINTDITVSIKELLNHDNFEFVWYENPKKTINSTYHLQVFWRII